MDEMGALSSITAKLVILADVVGDQWAVVANYVGGADGAILLEVTPVQCGREMYSNVAGILWASVHWLLPQLVDLMGGLALTSV